MNPKKVLPSEDGYNRDWRGLATLIKISQNEYSAVSQSNDKIMKLFEIWQNNNANATFYTLQQCLATIDRYDVSDDTFQLLGGFKI